MVALLVSFVVSALEECPPGINQKILQYFYSLQSFYWQMKYSMNLMLVIQKSNGKVQKSSKGKGLLVLKTPKLVCNKERETESCRGTEMIGDFWISISPPKDV